MLRKNTFFDFLNRGSGLEFEEYLRTHTRYRDYIDLHQVVLPFDYGNAEMEYHAIRNSCALFDISSSRKYRISGRGAGPFLDHLLTRPMSGLPAMRAAYTVFCNPDGMLKDDTIVYKLSQTDYLLMPAFDHGQYFHELRARLGVQDVSIVDSSDSLVGLALQGPLAATVLHRWGFAGVENLKPFDVREFALADGSMHVARLGFTADLGYECWFEPGLSGAFEEGILAMRAALGVDIPGYGLTAVEVCRLEGGLVVPGRDCATEYSPRPGFERSPFDLNLGWLVKFDGRDFVGRDALLAQGEQGARFALLSFEMQGRHRPERGTVVHAVIDGKETEVGVLTSSTWSWGLGRTIGHASVEVRYADYKRAHTYIDKERFDIALTRGPLINLPRRSVVPAPLIASGAQ